jgi:hypothetical protein
MNPENENKVDIDNPDDGINTSPNEEYRYRLEVKAGKQQSDGSTRTQRVFLEVDWPDITNVPVIKCIDGGTAATANWGSLENM